MRETRSSGSVEGVMSNRDPYSDLIFPHGLFHLLADQHGRGSASIGAGRHGGDIAGFEQEETSRRCAGAAGGDVSDDRHRRRLKLLNQVASGVEQSPGVLRRTRRISACWACACSMAWLTISTVTGCTMPSILTATTFCARTFAAPGRDEGA